MTWLRSRDLTILTIGLVRSVHCVSRVSSRLIAHFSKSIMRVFKIINHNVSWCRYTQDKRFTAIHGTDSNNWALKVNISLWAGTQLIHNPLYR